MKNIVLILLLSVSVLFANVGKITGIKGDVIIKRGAQELVPSVGFVLEKYDEIITKDKSKALLLFSDGTSITVGKESKMKVIEYMKDAEVPANNKANFGFDKGVFRSITGKIGKVNPAGFKLETKSSSLGIRGSEGLSIVKENGDIKHSTLSGGYFIVNKATGQVVEIPKGTTANFSGGKIAVVPTTKADVDEAQDSVGETTEQESENNVKEDDKKEDKAEEKKQDDGQNEEAKQNDDKEGDKKGDNEQKTEDNQNSETTQNNEGGGEQTAQSSQNSDPVASGTTEAEQSPPTQQLETNNNTQPEGVDTQLPQNQLDTPILDTPSLENLETVTIETPSIETPQIPDIPDIPETPEKTINSNPVLSYSLPEINENEVATITFTGLDIDGDKLIYEIVSIPLHGSISIDETTGKVFYTPNENYDGSDTFSIKVSDGKGGIDTKTVEFIVKNSVIENLQTYTPEGTLSSLMVDLATVTKEIVGSDTYNNLNVLEYGYILDNTNQKISTYLTGITTPAEVINQYIINNQTANYSGNVASFVNGVASGGTVNLNINFGNKTLTGNIHVTEGNWQANINSGTVSSYGFSSTNITGTSNYGAINSGNMAGKYYGPTASSVGGILQLNSGTNSVNAVFGGAKQ